MTLSIISDSASSATLPRRVRDNFLLGLDQASENVIDGLFLWSADHPFSFPEQAAPVIGETVKNLAGQDDGSWVRNTNAVGQMAWDAATKSVSFAATVAGNTGVQTPAGWEAGEFAASQHFLMAVYALLPSLANWPTVKGSTNGLVGDTPATGQQPKLGRIVVVRQNNTANGGAGSRAIWGSISKTGALDNFQIDENNGFDLSPYAGKWCQLAIWRKAAERGFSICALDDEATLYEATSATVNANANNLTGSAVTWGMDASCSSSNTYYHKVGRGLMLNLDTHDLDVPAALLADRARMRVRGLMV